MSTEKMREEYNVWYAEKIGVLGTRQHKEWFAPWSASRAAIEVELPERMEFAEKGGDYFDGARNGYNQCIDACAVSLRFAGLKVKP